MLRGARFHNGRRHGFGREGCLCRRHGGFHKLTYFCVVQMFVIRDADAAYLIARALRQKIRFRALHAVQKEQRYSVLIGGYRKYEAGHPL